MADNDIPQVELTDVPPGAPKGGFYVFSERCNQCLYGPNRIVPKKRAAALIKECNPRAGGGHFVCHKATLQGRDVACAGWAGQHLYDSMVARVARVIGRLFKVRQAEPEE